MDWLEIFHKLDSYNGRKQKAFIVSTKSQQKTYFDESSFDLTIQYLERFQKETEFLYDEQRLKHVNHELSLKIKLNKTSDILFDQTCFAATSNYEEFLKQYQEYIQNKLGNKEHLPNKIKTKQNIETFKEYGLIELLKKNDLFKNSTNSIHKLINQLYCNNISIPQKICLLNEFNILEKFKTDLEKDYNLSASQLSRKICKLLKLRFESVQPIINTTFINDKTSNKYPFTDKNLKFVNHFIDKELNTFQSN